MLFFPRTFHGSMFVCSDSFVLSFLLYKYIQCCERDMLFHTDTHTASSSCSSPVGEQEALKPNVCVYRPLRVRLALNASEE